MKDSEYIEVKKNENKKIDGNTKKENKKSWILAILISLGIIILSVIIK